MAAKALLESCKRKRESSIGHVAPPDTSVTPAPKHSPLVVKIAHGVINLAKDGKWAELYNQLDKHRCVVNVRPEVREYSVLHQAAFHGSADAVATLIDHYGADPMQHTRLGKSLVDVARECGHDGIVASLLARQKGLEPEPALSPEKVAKHDKKVATKSDTTVKSHDDLEEVTPLKVPKPELDPAVFIHASHSPPTLLPLPKLTPRVVKTAHALIDLAKEARWDQLYKMLDKQRNIVNVRPDVREYGVLHQAVYLGDQDAVATLIDDYGADPRLRSKFGNSSLDVAEERGHEKVLELLRTRLQGGPDPKAETAEQDLDDDFDMVQMADGSWKVSVKARVAAA